MFQPGCSIYHLLQGKTISWVLKNAGIRHVSNLNNFSRWYGSFYLPMYFHPSPPLFLLLIIYRSSFLVRRERSWIISNSLSIYLYTDGEMSVCACDNVCMHWSNESADRSVKMPSGFKRDLFFSSCCANNYKATGSWGISNIGKLVFTKLVLWWIGSQWLTIALIFYLLVYFLQNYLPLPRETYLCDCQKQSHLEAGRWSFCHILQPYNFIIKNCCTPCTGKKSFQVTFWRMWRIEHFNAMQNGKGERRVYVEKWVNMFTAARERGNTPEEIKWYRAVRVWWSFMNVGVYPSMRQRKLCVLKIGGPHFWNT